MSKTNRDTLNRPLVSETPRPCRHRLIGTHRIGKLVSGILAKRHHLSRVDPQMFSKRLKVSVKGCRKTMLTMSSRKCRYICSHPNGRPITLPHPRLAILWFFKTRSHKIHITRLFRSPAHNFPLNQPPHPTVAANL